MSIKSLTKSYGLNTNYKMYVSVYAMCHSQHIEVTVVLDDPSFYGVVHTRPNRDTCAVWATGDKHIKLFIPLTEPDMTDCGVVMVINSLTD